MKAGGRGGSKTYTAPARLIKSASGRGMTRAPGPAGSWRGCRTDLRDSAPAIDALPAATGERNWVSRWPASAAEMAGAAGAGDAPSPAMKKVPDAYTS